MTVHDRTRLIGQLSFFPGRFLARDAAPQQKKSPGGE
jgi:hypothetical protein